MNSKDAKTIKQYGCLHSGEHTVLELLSSNYRRRSALIGDYVLHRQLHFKLV